MRRKLWFLISHSLLLMEWCLLASARTTMDLRAQQKAESTIPTTSFSPPEGNTTFIGGTTWCVALPGVSQVDLQNALDWACGLGQADCSPVLSGGPCFQPDNVLSHASWAFNSYYQQNGNSDVACNFGGAASVTTRNPSYGSCSYPTSEPASYSPLQGPRSFSWGCFGLLLFLFLNAGG